MTKRYVLKNNMKFHEKYEKVDLKKYKMVILNSIFFQ